MTKATMPKPFMYGIMGSDDEPYFGESCVSGDKGDLAAEISDLNEGNDAGPYKEVTLITTDQAEAYAASKAQEVLHEEAKPDSIKRAEYYGEGYQDGWKIALKRAADVAKVISDKYAYGYYGNEVDTADEIEAAIRALIKQ